VSLTTSDYNGFAVSCFGDNDGWISAQVSGGTPPYRYTWSQGDTISQIGDLPAGYYHLAVVDADSGRVTTEVTLMQPSYLKVFTTPYLYPNGYNISCTNCFNGSIESSAAGGVPPYSFLWNDSVATQNRSNLGHKFNYEVTVTDASGCKLTSQRISLIQPDPNVWAMDGNSNTDPAVHFMGTSDSADFVLKSNGQARLQLTAQGDVKLLGQGHQPGLVFRMEDGTLRGGGLPQWPPLLPPLCYGGLEDVYPFWQTTGNSFDWLCPGITPLLGTLGDHPLIMVTDGVERVHITTDGRVGIGTQPPGNPMDGYRLYVEDGIATRDVLVKLGAWPDYVFADGYRLMPLNELRAFLKRNRHLPGIPSAATLEEQGGVAVGEMQRNLVRTVEEQALYILELEERLEKMEQRMKVLETTHR
jgi:hypothetical protein